MLYLLGATVIGSMLMHQTSLTRSLKQMNTRVADCPTRQWPMTEQIHIDPPVSTTLRDDRLGATTLRGVSNNLSSQYLREAVEHPGVALVAHTIN